MPDFNGGAAGFRVLPKIQESSYFSGPRRNWTAWLTAWNLPGQIEPGRVVNVSFLALY